MVWYVRVGKGAPRIRLRVAPGEEGFLAQYQAALRGEATATPVGAAAGTLAWLTARYRESPAWRGLSMATRRQREAILRRVLAQSGDVAARTIRRADIIATRDATGTPRNAARHLVVTLRGLFGWAVEAGHLAANPCEGVAAPQARTSGYHTWTDAEIAAYEARWPAGTRQRVALHVLLYTGLRRADAVRIGRQHVRDGLLSIRPQKTAGSTGAMVTLPILAPLAETLAAGPTGDLAFIAGEHGRPLTPESFGNAFRDWCKAAGVPGSAHGLRKAGARRAAEAGATLNELNALFGWEGERMALSYTRAADRVRLGKAAAGKLAAAPHLSDGAAHAPKPKLNSDT